MPIPFLKVSLDDMIDLKTPQKICIPINCFIELFSLRITNNIFIFDDEMYK